MKELFTLQILEEKQDFFLELLENFDFVSIQDNAIWREVLVNKNSIEEMKEEDKKPRRFTDFTLQDVKEIFEIEEEITPLFEEIKAIKPTSWLKSSLSKAQNLSLHTEKIRSEALIYPIIAETQEQSNFSFKFFSGENVNFNEEKGLKGELDFAFSKKKTSYLESPIFHLVEAKQGDITKHWGQIAAQMVGAKEENAKEGNHLEAIFGCISTGEYWHFIKLENDTFYIDKKHFSIYWELEKILGIFQYIVDFYKE